MPDKNSQTVADKSNGASQTTSGDSGAQEDNLDKILSEIDQDFDKDTKVPEKDADGKKDDVSELKGTVEYLASQMESSDIDKAVESISGSLEVQVPKKVVKAMLNDMAIDDPRVRKAFANRYKDPGTWNKVLKGATKTIRDEFSNLPDKQLTEDRDALAATVRGSSRTSSEDEAPNFSKMSDREFEEWKRKNA